MARSCFLCLFFLACVPAGLCAQEERPAFDLRPAPHPSETPRYRELAPGQWGVAWNVYYTLRSYNVTDIRGLDNSLATSWLNSFDFWGLGVRAHVEHRHSIDWRFSILPRLDAAYGILNSSYHNTFELEDLPLSRNYPSANDVQKLSLFTGVEAAARWRWLWLTARGDGWMVFRRREIRGYTVNFRDPQLGALSGVKDRKRVEWEQAYVYGAAVGTGFEFTFMPESSRIIIFTLLRPYNVVQFRGGSAVTHGFELSLRSADFELTDQSGCFFEFSVQAYLPAGEFNRVYYSQISLGAKFR
jgi:hypothetical protein